MRLLNLPTAEPVGLEEAKLAARISDTTAFDALVPGLITAARQMAEQETGQKLMQQTWRAELTDWPSTTDELPVYQATAAAVSYWSGSAWVTLAGSAYVFAASGRGTVLAPALGTSWPTLVRVAIGPRVRIDLTAGATDPDDVPECVRLYIKALVAFWVDNPAAGSVADMREAPFLRGLLDQARVY